MEVQERLEENGRRLREREEELGVVRGQLEKSERDRLDLQERLGELEVQCQSKQQVNVELNKYIDTVTTEKKELEKERQRLEQGTAHLGRQIEELQVVAGDANRLREENKTLSGELNGAQRELGGLQVKFKEEQLKRK